MRIESDGERRAQRRRPQGRGEAGRARSTARCAARPGTDIAHVRAVVRGSLSCSPCFRLDGLTARASKRVRGAAMYDSQTQRTADLLAPCMAPRLDASRPAPCDHAIATPAR